MTATKRGAMWAGILAVCVTGGGGQKATAQALPDANALIKKMLQTYRSASSIRDEAQANVTELGKGRYEQRSVLVYQTPNKLHINSVDPNQGTVSVYSDGRLVSIYSGKQNIFTRRNAVPGLAQTLVIAEKAAQDSFRVSLTQLLSPLSFLSGNGTIREALAFRTVGTETVAGYKAYKITAQAHPMLLQAVVPPRSSVQFGKKDITLWIDARRNTLVKASAQLTWKVTLPSDGFTPKRVIPGGLYFEETHRSTILNSAVKDEEFRFNPPQNAKELFQERRH